VTCEVKEQGTNRARFKIEKELSMPRRRGILQLQEHGIFRSGLSALMLLVLLVVVSLPHVANGWVPSFGYPNKKVGPTSHKNHHVYQDVSIQQQTSFSLLSRFETSHSRITLLQSTTDDEVEDDNHLIKAGTYFKDIDEDVGNAMCRAGVAWSSNWSQVAEALDEASKAFWDVLSKKNISPTLQGICRSVAQELEDISTIEGCSSIGPASSVPNWIAIHGYLNEAAAAYGQKVKETNEEKDQKTFAILTKISQEIEALIESI